MTEPTYTLRSRNADGTRNETHGLTAEQAAKLGNGQAAAWAVTDEQTIVGTPDMDDYRSHARRTVTLIDAQHESLAPHLERLRADVPQSV